MSLLGLVNNVRKIVEGTKSNGLIGDQLWDFLHKKATTYLKMKSAWRPGFHPSQMYSFCPRQKVLQFFFPKPEKELISPELNMIFDWGTAWHSVLQDSYFGPMGILYGKWTCMKCGYTHEGTQLNSPCPECGMGCRKQCKWEGGFGAADRDCRLCRIWGKWRYRELSVSHEELKMYGKMDGILEMDGARHLSEFKTMNSKKWATLTEPEPAHVFQVQLYLELEDYDILDAVISYWTKDSWQAPPKEFIVERDRSAFEETKRRITLYNRVWPKKRLCPGICGARGAPQGKYCLWKKECFKKDIEDIVDKERELCGISEKSDGSGAVEE